MLLMRKPTGDGPLIERMPYRILGQEGRATDAGFVTQFVDDPRIGNEAAASWDALCDVIGNETAQVAGMLMHYLTNIIKHLLVDFIHAARQRLGQTAPTDDSIKVERNVTGLQLFDNNILAIRKLIGRFTEGGELFGCMDNVFYELFFLVLINGDFRRGGTRINSQDLH